MRRRTAATVDMGRRRPGVVESRQPPCRHRGRTGRDSGRVRSIRPRAHRLLAGARRKSSAFLRALHRAPTRPSSGRVARASSGGRVCDRARVPRKPGLPGRSACSSTGLCARHSWPLAFVLPLLLIQDFVRSASFATRRPAVAFTTDAVWLLGFGLVWAVLSATDMASLGTLTLAWGLAAGAAAGCGLIGSGSSQGPERSTLAPQAPGHRAELLARVHGAHDVRTALSRGRRSDRRSQRRRRDARSSVALRSVAGAPHGNRSRRTSRGDALAPRAWRVGAYALLRHRRRRAGGGLDRVGNPPLIPTGLARNSDYRRELVRRRRADSPHGSLARHDIGDRRCVVGIAGARRGAPQRTVAAGNVDGDGGRRERRRLARRRSGRPGRHNNGRGSSSGVSGGGSCGSRASPGASEEASSVPVVSVFGRTR